MELEMPAESSGPLGRTQNQGYLLENRKGGISLAGAKILQEILFWNLQLGCVAC